MTTADTGAATALYRLLAWLSPNFPTGAFSYSHGLEAAVDVGTVCDRASLEGWVAAIVAYGSGRMDADILRDAYRAAERGDETALDAAKRRGLAFRATAELALESVQQGEAFAQTWRTAWDKTPHPNPPPHSPGQARGGEGDRHEGGGRVGVGSGDSVCHSAAFGAAAAHAGIALEDALIGYLQAFAGNLIAAGLRLGVVGQSDGQRILAALEPVVAAAAAAALARGTDDFGSATLAADLLSMQHEAQYTRLFRS